jgi:hypothetical protein
MCLRISSALILLGLALVGCTPAAAPPPGDAVECALGAGAALAAVCTFEREAGAGRFVLHHPGGGFRRLRFDAQTQAISAADGAERASNQASDGETLSFAVGEDHYRVPLRLLAGQP